MSAHASPETPGEDRPQTPLEIFQDRSDLEVVSAMADYQRHLREISGTPYGSLIEDYFPASVEDARRLDAIDPVDAGFIRGWYEKARRAGFPNAEPAEFRVPLLGDAWQRPKDNSGKNWLTRAIWYRKAWQGSIYQLGRLNTSIDSSIVGLDTEGYLRMYVSDRTHTGSRGMGWSRLPDPDIMRKLIGPDKPLITAAPTLIAHKLDSQLEPRVKFEKWPY